MLRLTKIFAALTLISLAGCGGYDGIQAPEGVEISGTVYGADGKPLKDVQLALRPKGEGHNAGGPVGPDGSFTVKATPGEFMFFFQPLEGQKVDKAKQKAGFNAIPEKYREVNVEHSVKLNAGAGNEIRLQ